MQNFTITIYGKEYSKETNLAKKYFEDRNIAYEYIDIEYESVYLEYIKSQKCYGIPVVKLTLPTSDKPYIFFVVGYKVETYDNLVLKATSSIN